MYVNQRLETSKCVRTGSNLVNISENEIKEEHESTEAVEIQLIVWRTSLVPYPQPHKFLSLVDPT